MKWTEQDVIDAVSQAMDEVEQLTKQPVDARSVLARVLGEQPGSSSQPGPAGESSLPPLGQRG